MGTNYYARGVDSEGRSKVWHIGKSSAGWVFALHVISDEGLSTLDDWKEFLEDKDIRGEYNRIISLKELISVITERGRDEPLDLSDYELRMNAAVPGPNNLLRHKMGNISPGGIGLRGSCVGHGEGTWDYIDAEFS
jgi:hypothetical protein